MNKAVFLLCPADHLCPSQTGGLDHDYDYYYYSVSRARSARPISQPAPRVLSQSTVDLTFVLEVVVTLCRHHEQSGIGSSWRSAAPHSASSSSSLFTRQQLSDTRGPPSVTAEAEPLPHSFSPLQCRVSVSTGVPVK